MDTCKLDIRLCMVPHSPSHINDIQKQPWRTRTPLVVPKVSTLYRLHAVYTVESLHIHSMLSCIGRCSYVGGYNCTPANTKGLKLGQSTGVQLKEVAAFRRHSKT